MKSKTVYENEVILKSNGVFYRTKEDNSAYKSKTGVKFFWQKDEKYNEWLERIIKSLKIN